MNVNSGALIAAIRGPVMLMTLGALILIDYLGVFRFSTTWPVLIILFGLFKLLERVVQGPQDYPPAGGPPANYPPANYPPGRNAI